MKKRIALMLGVCALLAACGKGTGAFDFNDPATMKKSGKATIRLTLLPQGPLEVGKPVVVMAKLTSLPDHVLIVDEDLEIAHTEKFHLLVADPALADYQHVHPQPTGLPGVYSFTFTPRVAGGYRAWADVTLAATHKQQFVMADLGNPRGGAIDKTETREATAGGYRFRLSFDKPPAAEGMAMGTISIADAKGRPVKNLEHVMGAYAHIVGFHEDFRTVVHTHPMGNEPGPEVMFHLEPAKPGFIKLFAQVKIGGKEIFAPFGVMAAGSR